MLRAIHGGIMRVFKLSATVIAALFLGACASSEKAKQATTESISDTSNTLAKGNISQSTIDQLVSDWPEASQKATKKTIEKYGLPNEASGSMIVWHNNRPWKRTIIYKEELTHLFPKKHSDVLEQFIDYKVPPAKFSDLAKFDGSVIAERTKGEISARCDKEEMNQLAINLADEIVRGKKTVAEARKEYGKSAMAFMMGKTNHYTEALQVKPMPNSPDPDQSVMKDMMGGMPAGTSETETK